MKKIFTFLLTLSLAAACLTACGSRQGGTVSTDGSTSMSRVIGALGESFQNDTGVKVTYNATGSGSGIQAVQEGRCDIGLSSRSLKPSELDDGLTATVLAYDGIAVIVHPGNPVSGLTLSQLADIYTGKLTNWRDVGGSDGDIVLIGREANSGTRAGFETITGTAEKCLYRQELSSNGDVITTVANNPNAIGYASLATVKDSVKCLSVDGVTPDEVTVQSGAYPVQRPFVLVTRADTPLSDAAQRFFDYATSPAAGDVISAAGAVPAN